MGWRSFICVLFFYIGYCCGCSFVRGAGVDSKQWAHHNAKLSGVIIPGLASTRLRAWALLDCPFSPLDFRPLDPVWLDTRKVCWIVFLAFDYAMLYCMDWLYFPLLKFDYTMLVSCCIVWIHTSKELYWLFSALYINVSGLFLYFLAWCRKFTFFFCIARLGTENVCCFLALSCLSTTSRLILGVHVLWLIS